MTDMLLPTRTGFGERSVLPSDLVRAYQNTVYALWWMALTVDDGTGFYEFTLDRYVEPLDAIFQITGCETAALITAANPLGETLSETENERLNQELRGHVAGLGFRSTPAYGRDPAGKWPREESLLVSGLSFEAALRLGRRYRQNAIVWSDETFTPRLILLR